MSDDELRALAYGAPISDKKCAEIIQPLAAEVLALRAERERLRKALEAVMPLLASAESNASGNPEHYYVQPRVDLARAALYRGKP